MISSTFQRLSYSPIHDKTSLLSYSSPVLLEPPIKTENEFTSSLCLSPSYDDICIDNSNTSASPLLYPNVTLLTSLPKTRTTLSSSISSAFSIRSSLSSSTSTLSYQELNSSLIYSLNSTRNPDLPPLIVSVRTPLSGRIRRFFHWKYLWILLIPVLSGILLCILIALIAYIKYRRKDVGVYEVEEAQRFRPPIVELSLTPGEYQQDNLNSTTVTNSLINLTNKNDTTKKRQNKRRKLPINSNNDQREFYI